VVPLVAGAFPTVRGAGLTHRGLIRERNEDSILTDPSGRLWAVADGMGGYGHGDVASDIVIDCLEQIEDEEEPATALAERLSEANTAVRRLAATPGLGQMGSTVVALIIDRARAHFAWAGDSRGYLLRAGQLRLITRDHTVVQNLIDQGELRPEAAEQHPESHIVTRAVGGDDGLEVEFATLPLIQGDRIMLCSDGLPRCVYEQTIEELLAGAATAENTCRALVAEALAQGAPDNVSVIVIDIGEA